MKDTGMDENTEKTLQEAFGPTTLSAEYRNQLLKDLITKMSSNMKASKSRFWKKPELWIAVTAVVVLSVIAYGIWLPYSVWDKLTS